MPKVSRSATDSLAAHFAGDPGAANDLLPLVYSELRALACDYMKRERRDDSLTPTAVVHEAYLRLIDNTRTDWRGRTHFFAVAAVPMRRVLVYTRMGRLDEAEGLLQEALKQRRVVLAESHPAFGYSHYSLGCLVAVRGQRTTALDFLRKAVDLGWAE